MATIYRKYADALLEEAGRRGISMAALSRMSGLHVKTIYNIVNARSMPSRMSWETLRSYIKLPSWDELRAGGAK